MFLILKCVVLNPFPMWFTFSCPSSWKYDDLMQFINDELIQRHKNLLEMGEAVLEESISRAITNFGAKHYDDACLVVWQFTPQRVPNAAASSSSSSASAAAAAPQLNGIGGHAAQSSQQSAASSQDTRMSE
jgi:hypothetical protein